MEIFVYYKINNELIFDKFEAKYGGNDNSCIYYNFNSYSCPNRIETKDIGKVINKKCCLLERNDNKASKIFAEEYAKEIEELQSKILELQKNQETNKVTWFKNGEGVLEEIILNNKIV